MKKIAFDNEYYLKIQREEILKRINSFGDKLYLEFGGKLFDDFHASRVLPGFKPDSKLRMLLGLKDKAENLTPADVNAYMKSVANASYGYTEEQLVSSDIIGMTYG